MYCTNCGYENKSNSKFCKRCGSPLDTEEVMEKSSEEIVIIEEKSKREYPPPPVQVESDAPTFERTHSSGNAAPVTQTYSYEPEQPMLTEYGGYWRRMAALLIDTIIICGIAMIPAIFIFVILDLVVGTRQADRFIDSFNFEILMYAIFLVISVIYFTIQESSVYQASFGKRLLKLLVTDQDGERLTRKAALIRSLGKIISAAILWIGVLMIAFSERKQGLHDRIAKTFVYHIDESHNQK